MDGHSPTSSYLISAGYLSYSPVPPALWNNAGNGPAPSGTTKGLIVFHSSHRGRRRLGMLAVAATLIAVGATLAGGTSPAYADGGGVSAYILGDTTFRITTSTSLALDVAGGSLDDNAPVIQWPVNGGANQSWLVIQTSGTQWFGGNYLIINANSGKCLSVAGPSPDAGAQLVQYTCYGALSQIWYATGGPYVYQIHSEASDNVIDIPGNQGATWGTQIEQWPNNGGTNQWLLFTALD